MSAIPSSDRAFAHPRTGGRARAMQNTGRVIIRFSSNRAPREYSTGPSAYSSGEKIIHWLPRVFP